MSETSASGSAVCTLFEGHYHYGVGALVNSLYRHGFRGVVWVGYRGDLPAWARAARRTPSGYDLEVAPGCIVRFLPLQTEIFFSNYKPYFMLDLWDHYGLEAERLFYFDPDIVIKCRWSFFEEWVDTGVALCLDGAYAHMPATHPFRRQWQAFACRHGLQVRRCPDEYYNGGFIGVRREHRALLEAWRTLMEAVREEGINITSFKNFEGYNIGDRSHPFYVADQDMLNLSVMVTDVPLSVMGTDAMDFTGAGFTMSHAVDAPKPWKKNFLWLLLKRGRLPVLADAEFLKYIDGPIRLYSPLHLRLKRLNYLASKAVGTFYHRH